ncbi:cytidine deaminase [Enterococcus gallinarum]|uniref:Cytidine deaminase n=1 Tax=Enterococcus gallinarum TaxID=1353 RepID=A0ABD4HQJ1_ENTGA|nr:cytidine deaminase [Enterococcus gallinarum]MBA0949432.1 cytidine deaminase [Enterococcus gallinarum]MBA0962429.1 cytidine deaminase [Enterococcus gallinarum]MBA0970364.1 cytidine deaminase [Enterococcus gallinarum]MBA0973754.1 cytidine deaminase [Enterococcus gallinarum]MCR1931903.1 cytidine deaminase [Enterococcus gallinarum]
MKAETRLFETVKSELLQRYPTGWGGVAGAYLDTDEIVIGISPDFPNAGSSVCMELGCMLEAAKMNARITHTLCLVREDENAPFKVLSPCGICQERLALWGGDVLCALTTKDVDRIDFAELRSLQPHHWLEAYQK